MSETTAAVPPGEQIIAQLLNRRMEAENTLIPGERAAVAYSIAELMVAAKDMYTQYLPRLSKEESNDTPLEEEISGFRMALLNLRDLITDFDNAFLDAMYSERKSNPDQVYDQWRDPDADANGDDNGEEWTAEDLGVSEEEMQD